MSVWKLSDRFNLPQSGNRDGNRLVFKWFLSRGRNYNMFVPKSTVNTISHFSVKETSLTLDTVWLHVPPFLWADLLVLDQVVADGHAAMRVGLHEGDGRQALGNSWETHWVRIWRNIWKDKIMTWAKRTQTLNDFPCPEALPWFQELLLIWKSYFTNFYEWKRDSAGVIDVKHSRLMSESDCSVLHVKVSVLQEKNELHLKCITHKTPSL